MRQSAQASIEGSIAIDRYSNHWFNQMKIQSFWRQELSRPRYQQAKRLPQHGFKTHSQNDEDGIIHEIFERIGTQSRCFVEFGVGTGSECNSLLLLLSGWRGLWLEAGVDKIAQIKASHRDFIDQGRLGVAKAHVTTATIEALISDGLAAITCTDVDLLSIDIDFNDYWIWQAITKIKPRLVVVEYNALWRPPLSVTVPYDADARWDGSGHFGASLAALSKLGCQKGYQLVGCCLAGVNAFFVREDLCGDHFFAPGDAGEHFEPARYFLSALAPGHPTRIAPLQQI